VKASGSKPRRRLVAAQKAGTLVRVSRRLRRSTPLDGVVVAVGAKWALMASFVNGGYADGYVAVRVRDVATVSRDRGVGSLFARTQPSWPPVAPSGLDLDTTKAMLRTLAQHGPLVGVERERERAGLWIGVLVGFERRWLWLHEVRPSARWYKVPHGYKLGTVTTAWLGGRYLDALAATASKPRIPTTNRTLAPVEHAPWPGRVGEPSA
jgi:hypothetical protein